MPDFPAYIMNHTYVIMLKMLYIQFVKGNTIGNLALRILAYIVTESWILHKNSMAFLIMK